MTIISLFLFKYALVVVAVYGLIESGRIVQLNRGDLRILLREKVNGPKKLSTELRINQSQFLLAAFFVMLLVGSILALAPTRDPAYYFLTEVIATRLGLLLLGAVLIWKQRSVRRHRERLDGYYDQQQLAQEQAKVHMHRRSSDPPVEGGQ